MNSRHLSGTLATSLTASLSILLAACGSGEDNQPNKAVLSSPAANTAATTSSADSNLKAPLSSEALAAPAAAGTPPVSAPPPDTPSATPPMAAVSPGGANTVPNISDTGVRGDVLLAMIEQNTCETQTGMRQGVSGPAIPSAEQDTPPVTLSVKLDKAGNYTFDPNDFNPGDTFVQRPCRRRFYKPTGNGTYNYVIKTENNYFRIRARPMFGETWLKRGFNNLTASYTIIIRDNDFLIGQDTQIESTEDLGYRLSYADYTNHAPTTGGRDTPYFRGLPEALTIARNGMVSFGTLREWTGRLSNGNGRPHDFARLMLIRGDKPNQAKLCTHLEVNYAKRLVCTAWDIPDAWKWGEELHYAGGYIIDDRSAYPNETGFLYWQN